MERISRWVQRRALHTTKFMRKARGGKGKRIEDRGWRIAIFDPRFSILDVLKAAS